MLRYLLFAGLLSSSLAPRTLNAQDGVFSGWFDRSDAAKEDQPHWMTPLVTVTPRLEQEFRTDFLVEPNVNGQDLVNFGNSKGLELIPVENVELIFNVPPYLEHNQPKAMDGFGDVSFLGKYRVLHRNEGTGNYILTFFFAATVPTGTYKNGARAGVVTPTIAAGKGLGKFDFQSTFGAGLPVSHLETMGHALTFNNAFQYHISPKFWPEVEVNSTFYKDGENDGRKQTFVTPGIIFGRFKLGSRLAMAAGAGYQIAVTQYHAYNHAAVFTIRFPF